MLLHRGIEAGISKYETCNKNKCQKSGHHKMNFSETEGISMAWCKTTVTPALVVHYSLLGSQHTIESLI